VRIGVTLPQFQPDAERCIEVAGQAEDAGLDGVFVFDHLWPIGRPDGDVLSMLPLLAAVAVETTAIRIGSFVARVGVVPDAVLIHQLVTVNRIAGGRLIAGLGTGDRLSAGENLAFGVPYPSAEERLANLGHCAELARDAGLEVWLGGRTPAVRAIALEAQAAVNLWAAPAPEVAEVAAAGCEATWGGQVLIGRDADDAGAKLARHGSRRDLVHGTVDEVAAHLGALADAGAAWSVCAPLDIGEPGAIETLSLVAERLR
jgi:alkanesulfonate monooxygenase SsuD/methylene tetrahydromethanopterin reductase-like flavin-dependent oxidoreductase (luciferase family)